MYALTFIKYLQINFVFMNSMVIFAFCIKYGYATLTFDQYRCLKAMVEYCIQIINDYMNYEPKKGSRFEIYLNRRSF